MEVKAGYRYTELGVIPEDWEIRRLGELATFLDSQRRPIKDSDRSKMKGSIPYYGASGIIDYVNDYLFDENLILLGEDGENILSRNSRLAFQISGKTWVNNHAHVLRPNTDVCLNFLTELLESLDYETFNSGTAQPKLTKDTCSRLTFAFPPTKAEQQAIADALSDADALIESLEQLIAKKRQIKQGVMQELLTGKRRLPGYGEKWGIKKLGQALSLQYGKGQQGISSPNGKYPIIGTGGKVGLTDYFIYDKPSIIIGRKGTIDTPQYVETPFWPIDTTYYSIVSEREDVKFLSYLFTTINWGAFIEATGVPSLNAKTLEKININLPQKSEQVAISKVLCDIDDEINALEVKLEKTRQIKQGMMHELLTGRIRLL